MLKPQFTLPDEVESALYKYLLELKEAYGSGITISHAVRRLLITHPALGQPGARVVPEHPANKDIPRYSILPATYEEYTYENWTYLMQNSYGALNIAFTAGRDGRLAEIFDGGWHEDIPAAFKRWEDAGRPTSKKGLAAL